MSRPSLLSRCKPRHRPSLVAVVGLTLLAALALPRCAEEFEFQGVLGQPIAVQLLGSIPLMPALAADRSLLVALDFGAPLTTIDLGPEGASETVEMRLLEAPPAGQKASIARLLFPALDVRTAPMDSLALGEPVTPVNGIVGADVLEHFTVQFELSAPVGPRVTFLAERPGSDNDLAQFPECQAVFDYQLAGGGDFEASACVDDLPARRIVLPTCLDDAEGRTAEFALIPSLAVESIVLGDSSYLRLHPQGRDNCKPAALQIGGEPVEGACRTTFVPGSAASVVSDEDDERGACAELQGPRKTDVACAASATTFDVPIYVVPDEVLASVRLEIGGRTDTVDGYLGAAFFAPFSLWYDAPASRLTMQCACLRGRTLDTPCNCTDQVRSTEATACRSCGTSQAN